MLSSILQPYHRSKRSKSLTSVEVSKHSTKKDLYIVIHDKVYNVSTFIDEHPGGEEVLLDYGGRDATQAFENVGHSEKAREILDGLQIGALAEAPTIPVETKDRVIDASLECGSDCVLKQLHSSMPTQQSWGSREAADSFKPPLPNLNDVDYISVYQPLRPWQTRLVELIPDPEGKMPSCRLITAEFIDMEGVGLPETSEIVHYSALSYVWGEMEHDAVIRCNESWFPITSNLATALFHLSKSGPATYLWCDAICINQTDNKERTLQVKNMLRIFEKAEKVIAWLGPLGGRELQSLAVAKREATQNPHFYEQVRGKRHTSECRLGLTIMQTTLRNFSARTWFERTWIRQEVFAAQKISLHFIDFKMDFDFFTNDFWRWLALDPQAPGDPPLLTTDQVVPEKFGVLPQFHILCQHFRHNGTDHRDFKVPQQRLPYPLFCLQLLQQGSHFEASDPKDHVYALLGIMRSPATRLLVEQGAEEALPVDYDKTVSMIYQDFVKHLINASGGLDVLDMVEDRRYRANDIPSWTPDWRKRHFRAFLSQYITSENRSKIGKAPSEDLADYGRLIVEGMFIVDPKVTTLDGTVDYTVETSDAAKASLMRQVGEQAYVLCNHRWGQDLSTESLARFWVPRTAMLYDVIVRLKGCMSYSLLRPTERSGTYSFVGPVIISGKVFDLSAKKDTHRLARSRLGLDAQGWTDWDMFKDLVVKFEIV